MSNENASPVVIHNTNINTVSGRSGFGIAYLVLFLLGFITFGVTWMLMPILAVVQLCVSIASPRPARPYSAPQSPPDFQLVGEHDRAYASRVLNLGFSENYLSEEEYSRRYMEIDSAKVIGDLKALTQDLPDELRRRARYKK
jgi:hypothetical protein